MSLRASNRSARFARACQILWRALGIVVCSAAAQVSAQPADELPKLLLVLPAELTSDQHVVATLRVTLPDNAAPALLVTPFYEGAAIEVVRGRLLRSDARGTGNVLEFALPLRTRMPGSAVLGARVLAFVCHDACRKVSAETRMHVVVLPP